MTALLEHFHEAVNTPEDVDKIKRLILQLAIQGKLVEQDSSDEPASKLLNWIEAEKLQLIKEKKIKKEKLTPISTNDLLNHPIPQGWGLAKIGEIMTPINGKAFKPSEWSDKGLPIIRIQNLNNLFAPFNYFDSGIEEKFIVNNGDILIGWSGTPGTSFGAFLWNRGKAVLNQHIFKANFYGEFLDKEYIMYSINARLDEMISKAHGGVGLQHITKGKFLEIILTIPPIKEQIRIVSKIKELFEKCDQLVTDLVKKQTTSALLNKSVFTRLQSHSNPEQIKDLRFVIENMEYLCNDKESIAQLHNAVLSLAVQGKLAEQDVNDEPASVLIEKIQEEKERLIAEKKIKKEKQLPPITEEEIPYELPKGWEWVRLQELAFLITKGSSPKWQGVEYTENPNDVLFITSENVGNFELLLSKKKYVQTKFNEIEPRSILQKGDILMNIVGASIGRTAIYELEENANINQAVCLIRVSTKIDKNYLLLFFNSNLCKEYMYDNQVDNARANLSMSNIAKFLIPLPPLSVQRGIVNMINSTFKLSSNLERRVEENIKYRQGMLNSLLSKNI